MTYLGAFAIILAVFMAWRCYSLYLGDELSHTRVLLRALRSYRERMKCYLESPSEWARGYDDELLEASGFLGALKGGESLLAAYKSTKDGLYITGACDEIIEGCFERLGDGYLDTELEVMESAIGGVECEEKRLSEDISRRKRVAGALLGALAVGVVILII